MNNRIARLRRYLERLLLDRAAGLWKYLPQHNEIVQTLVDTLTSDTYLQTKPPLGPTQYVLGLPAAQADAVRQNNRLLDVLAIAIHQAGRDIGLRFAILPRVLLDSRADLPPDGFRLEATLWEPEYLQAVPIDPDINTPPPSAYVVINGAQVFALEQPIIHIGRRQDNDLLLDDPRISRLHAQLRATHGRYMLFDLNSTGGTFVNNQRIRATVLYPGDTILLAGVTLVYGQRSTRPLQSTPKQPLAVDTTPNVATTMRLRHPLHNFKQDKPSGE